MRFGEALNHLIDSENGIVTRSDWYNSMAKPVVRLQRPDLGSKMTEPYLYMEKLVNKNGKYEIAMFPLDLSCESILSDKWEIVN